MSFFFKNGGSCPDGATTLSIMTLSIMTLCIMTLSIMKLNIMTLSIMKLSIMKLSIMTLSIILSLLSIIDLIVTLDAKIIQHNDNQHAHT
jgi:hypothetical protein